MSYKELGDKLSEQETTGKSQLLETVKKLNTKASEYEELQKVKNKIEDELNNTRKELEGKKEELEVGKERNKNFTPSKGLEPVTLRLKA